MKINEFLNFDMNQLSLMSDADLRAVASAGRKAANQRITRLKAAGATNTPAMASLPVRVRKSGFVTKDMNRVKLMNTIAQEQQFLRANTSTVKGWRYVQQKAADGAVPKGRIGYDIEGKPVVLKPGEKPAVTVKQINRYWELRNRAAQMGGKLIDKYESVVGAEIAQILKEHPRMSMDNLEKILQQRVTGLYEKQEENYNAARSGKGKTIY